MEQHPVPQNITSFEFRLIGDMTLKQFTFLASAALLAYIIYQLPLIFILRLPLAFLIAFTGVAFAFLPFEDRPLHRWFLAFLKSIYSPTQYVFQKSEEVPLYLHPDFPQSTQKIVPTFKVAESRKKLEEYLKTLPPSLHTTLETQEEESLKKIQALLRTLAAFPLPQLTTTPPPRPTPPLSVPLKVKLRRVAPPPPSRETPVPPPQRKLVFTESGRLLFEEEGKTVPTIPFSPQKIASRSDLLVEEIKKLKAAIGQLQEKHPIPGTPPAELLDYEKRLATLQKQLEEAENEKEQLMRAMLRLQKEMAPKPKGIRPQEILEKGEGVKIISAEAAKAAGLPKLTDIPNIVTGVVTTKSGTFLPNILVEIKDEKGNSVRAFKTNKLGQFLAATPLENGTYTIELEDPRQEFAFDIIEVKVDGSVLPPLAIFAKDQAEIEKEKIHRSLFGSKSSEISN